MAWITTLTTVQQWALGIVVSLSLLMFTHRLAMWREKRSRFAAASISFRNAFTTELNILTRPNAAEINVRTLLLDAFDRHSAAVTNFRHHLSWLRKRKFDRTWQQYHSGHGFDAAKFHIPPEDRIFLEYVSVTESSLAIPLAIERIHALLRFATET